jgi:hypothetical protein
VKEAMAMGNRHLLQRVGREYTKNLLWMGVVFGLLAAVLVLATNLPPVGTRWLSLASAWPLRRR